MAANITDKFNKASSGNGNYPTLAKVATARSTGDAILVCEDLTGWATDTAVHFSTYKIDADGAVDPTTQTDWKGVVSGDTITNLTRIAGAADTGNAVGDIVELNPTIGWLSDFVDGVLASHNQNGSIKAGAVTNTAIADGAVDSTKLGAGAVTNAKLASGAVKSDNVDFTNFKVWMPDYAHRDTSTNLFPGISGSSTITETGFIHIYLSGFNLQGAEVSFAILINGVEVAGGTNSNGYAVVSVDDVIPVAAGDVITFTKSAATMSSQRNKIYFIPGRWV